MAGQLTASSQLKAQAPHDIGVIFSHLYSNNIKKAGKRIYSHAKQSVQRSSTTQQDVGRILVFIIDFANFTICF